MSIPHASKSNATMPVGRNVAAFTLRWYMRVVGSVLLGYACYLLWGNRVSPGEHVLKAGPLIVLSGAGIIGSFGVNEKHTRSFISFFIALFGGLVLFSDAMSQSLIATFINDGLDPQRAQLVAALMMTAATALLGAALGRRKLGACVGGAIMFWFGYLASFIQFELQPARDPSGNLEPLNSGALLIAAMMIIFLVFASSSSDLFLFAPDVGLHTVPTVHTGGGQHMPAHGTLAHESVISAALNG